MSWVCVKEMVYPCPVCGKASNRQGEPFTSESQTLAHIDGSHDAAHSGEQSGDHRGNIDPEDDPSGAMAGLEDETTGATDGAGPVGEIGASSSMSSMETDATGDDDDEQDDDGLGGVLFAVGLVALVLFSIGSGSSPSTGYNRPPFR